METDAGPGRLTGRRRRLLAATAVLLTVLAGATTVAGYLALRAHRDHEAGAVADAAALAAAKDCVAATQPVDVTAIPASQHKLDDCATGAFGTQAGWYSAILTEAYQAQNMHVRLPEMDAAVERTNDDGSIVALVVFRATISQQGMPDRENSYRIRVTMVRRDGQYKISQLDQVAK